MCNSRRIPCHSLSSVNICWLFLFRQHLLLAISTLFCLIGLYDCALRPYVFIFSDHDRNAELAQLLQQKLNAYKADEPTLGEGNGLLKW